MDKISEDFLDAWLKLSVILRNKRYMINLSFNEGIICHLLYKESLKDKKGIALKDICSKTKILKSQVNRLITGLENKKIINRNKSLEDKRVVLVSLSEYGEKVYKKEYSRIIKLVNGLVKKIGEEKTKTATDIFELVAENVEILHGRESWL